MNLNSKHFAKEIRNNLEGNLSYIIKFYFYGGNNYNLAFHRIFIAGCVKTSFIHLDVSRSVKWKWMNGNRYFCDFNMPVSNETPVSSIVS